MHQFSTAEEQHAKYSLLLYLHRVKCDSKSRSITMAIFYEKIFGAYQTVVPEAEDDTRLIIRVS
jgi:hypothetical protein